MTGSLINVAVQEGESEFSMGWVAAAIVAFLLLLAALLSGGGFPGRGGE